MEEGEKKHKLFLSSEKKNGENKYISQLKVQGKQNISTKQQHILREVKIFYENL